MKKSYHTITYLLLLFNLGIGIFTAQQNWNTGIIYMWGAMTGEMPQVQTLAQFPPFLQIFTSLGQIPDMFTHVITGIPLLLLRATYASFLHFSWIHLLSNALVLYLVGIKFEDVNYKGTLLPVYFISGIGSMIAAYIIQPNALTAGASGAIFGMIGASLAMVFKSYIAKKHNNMDVMIATQYTKLGEITIGLLVVNIISTFTTPDISIVGHIAGLIIGVILGIIIPIRKQV